MLEARQLECTRGDRRLFSRLSFRLSRGQLLRVAGANGSGKTSLLRIMCGLLAPSAGELRWQGRPIRAEREEYCRNLAFVGHLNALKDDLTPVENLQVAAVLAGMPADTGRMLAGLDRFGIAHCADLPTKVLSQGQRRRAALARLALSPAVPLWILDEPFSALDVGAVVELERLLAAHLASGGMVVLTTHQEVQVVAHAVLRIDLDLHTAALLAA